MPDDPRRGDHGEWDALAVGWALSALEPHDEARFAVHLPTCQRCTAAVRETLRTVSDLAYAVPDEPPPAALKDRILAAAAAEPRQPDSLPELGRRRTVAEPPPHAPGAVGTPAGLPGHDVPRHDVPRHDVPRADPPRADPPRADPLRADVPPPPRRRHAAPADVVPLEPRRRRWSAVVASAAAVAVIAVLGAWNYQLRSDRDDLRTVVAQREAAISQLTANGPAKVAAVQAVNSKLELQPTRRATIVVQNGRTTIIVESLSPTRDDDTYWLWTLNCDVTNLKPIEGFRVSNRFSVQNVPSRPGLATTQCFALSAEDTPGTPVKPGRVVAVGELK